MKSECDKIAVLISDYADGKLDAGEQARLEAHLAACNECRLKVEQTRLLIEHLRILSGEHAPCDLWSMVSARIATQDHRGFLSRLITAAGWKTFAFAAPAAAAIVLGVMALRPSQPPVPPVKPVAASQQVASTEYKAYIQAYSEFRSAQPLSDKAALAAAAQLQREPVTAR